jgi:hypothetical protein
MTNIAMLIKSLPYSDQILIERVIAGCQQFVENMENQWYGRRVRHPKISDRQLVQLSVLFPSVSNSFRPFPQVNSRLSDVKNVNPASVYRSLKTLVNVNYYQKSKGNKHSDITGSNILYSKTKEANELEELVSRPEPRNIIYSKLLQSGILERYHRICNYREMLMCKHVDFDKISVAQKARGNTEVDKKAYTDNQELLKSKSNREIFFVAGNLAMKDLQNKTLTDPTYTEFFIIGGLSYAEIELSSWKITHKI